MVGKKRGIKGGSKSSGMSNWKNEMGKVLRTIHVVERIRISGVLGARFYMLQIICKSLNRVSSRAN